PELMLIGDLMNHAHHVLPVVRERRRTDTDQSGLDSAARDGGTRSVWPRAERDVAQAGHAACAADGVQVEIDARVRAGREQCAQLRHAVRRRDAERAKVCGRAEAVELQPEEEEGAITARTNGWAAL